MTSCDYSATPTEVSSETATPAPMAWIDSPRDGMHLSPGEYEIIAHGSDLIGVTSMEISVNGLPMANEPGTGSDLFLVTLQKAWTPTDPGEYDIQVRAQNSSGAWSDPASVTVWIDQETALPSPTASPSPTSTLTPTPTSTLTPTITTTTQPESLSDIDISPEKVSYYPRCPPNEITAQVRAFDPDGISAMALYYRLKDKSNGDVSDWYNADISKIGDDLYQSVFIPVTPTHPLADFLRPRLEKQGDAFAALVQIQFVMYDTKENIFRSEVYSSVTLKGCAP
jgi:hypothetical protein